MSERPNPTMEPEEYHVELMDGQNRTVDRVITLDNGWPPCWVGIPDDGRRNIRYPPHRVKQVQAIHERAGRTMTALEVEA